MEEDTRDKDLAKAVSVSERLSSYAEKKGVKETDSTSIIRGWRERKQSRSF